MGERREAEQAVVLVGRLWASPLRYEREPIAIGLCQCERYQRHPGPASIIGMVFPKTAVTIEDRLACYEAMVSGQRWA